eukprot:4868746-Alexandrium_andersonii.AAC.1
MSASLVGSEMCIRDSSGTVSSWISHATFAGRARRKDRPSMATACTAPCLMQPGFMVVPPDGRSFTVSRQGISIGRAAAMEGTSASTGHPKLSGRQR